MKNLVYPKIEDNNVTFHWTDQLGDVLRIHIWPGIFCDYHWGIWNAANAILPDIMQELDKSKTVKIYGHSLGAAMGMMTGILLQDYGYGVEVDVSGSYPISNTGKTVPGKHTMNGNDIVCKLFPWLKYPCDEVHIGEPRKWWKLSVKDHVTYPNVKGAGKI